MRIERPCPRHPDHQAAAQPARDQAPLPNPLMHRDTSPSSTRPRPTTPDQPVKIGKMAPGETGHPARTKTPEAAETRRRRLPAASPRFRRNPCEHRTLTPNTEPTRMNLSQKDSAPARRFPPPFMGYQPFSPPPLALSGTRFSADAFLPPPRFSWLDSHATSRIFTFPL